MSDINLQQKINQSIAELSKIADTLPAVVLVHRINDGKVVWISERGQQQLNTTLEEIVELTAEEYYSKYFNAEDAKDYVPKILRLIENNNDEEICTFFQQVRFSPESDYNWHMASTKIFLRDANDQPLLTITMAIPIDAMHHMAQKASKLLAENNFLRKNIQKFAKLSPREREILKHWAMGKSAIETGQELFIAVHTVGTHRKNIRQKLGTGAYADISSYARAFDLI